MTSRIMVNPSERLTVWSWAVGHVCTTGGPTGRLPDGEEHTFGMYQVFTETHRKKVFEQSFNSNKPDQWLRAFRQKFHQWLDSRKVPIREVVMMELVLAKLPAWHEAQMRNLHFYTELTESIVRYLRNQRTKTERLPFK